MVVLPVKGFPSWRSELQDTRRRPTTAKGTALERVQAYNQAMPVGWKDHIVSDAEILHGKPRLKGTRIPVSLVLGYLAAGSSPAQIVAEFPDLNHDQIAACLDYARDLAEFAVEA